MCFDFVIENKDRGSLNTSERIIDFYGIYNEDISYVRGFDLNDKDGDVFGMNYHYGARSVNIERHLG